MSNSLPLYAKKLKESGASGFYVKAGKKPELILAGEAVPTDDPALSNQELEKILMTFLDKEKIGILVKQKQLKFNLKIGALGQFRIVVALEGLSYSLRLSLPDSVESDDTVGGTGPRVPANPTPVPVKPTAVAPNATPVPARPVTASPTPVPTPKPAGSADTSGPARVPMPARLQSLMANRSDGGAPVAVAEDPAPAPRAATIPPPARVLAAQTPVPQARVAPPPEPEPEAIEPEPILDDPPAPPPKLVVPVGKIAPLAESDVPEEEETIDELLRQRNLPPRPVPHPGATSLLHELMGMLLDQSGSDIHLKQGRTPCIRIHGHLTMVKPEPLTYGLLWGMAEEIAGEKMMPKLIKDLQLDFAYRFKEICRFRANLYWDLNGLGIVLRIIPFKIPNWRALGVPEVVRKLAFKEHGLLLVTGPTGSGKSTTLAALLDDINQTEYKHIITLEEPIEFVHKDSRCSVVQREVPTDTPTFSAGVIDAMRQDPDVILVGEMRGYETMSNALMAAEAGRLVFATLHTTSAAQTVERILNVFPEESQSSARYQLAQNLIGIVCQALMPKMGGGRIAGYEILVANTGIRAALRENKAYAIQSMLETGKQEGMQTLDQHLIDLMEERKISFETAYSYCQDPTRFQKLEAQYGGKS